MSSRVQTLSTSLLVCTETHFPDIKLIYEEWDTVQAQRDFEATPEFKVFMTKFESLIQPVPVPLFFLYFDRSTISFITAGLGTTEVATFYNPSTTYLSKLRGFLERLDQSKPDGYIESAAGLSYEDDLEKEGGTKGKGKAVVLLIRWESRDAQKRFAQAEEWKDFLAEYFKLVKEEGGDTKMVSKSTMFDIDQTNISRSLQTFKPSSLASPTTRRLS